MAFFEEDLDQQIAADEARYQKEDRDYEYYRRKRKQKSEHKQREKMKNTKRFSY
jgi:hypothetical protein